MEQKKVEVTVNDYGDLNEKQIDRELKLCVMDFTEQVIDINNIDGLNCFIETLCNMRELVMKLEGK